MPGNVVALSGVTDTYPFSTFAAFSVSLASPAAIHDYPDGSSQRRSKQQNPRHSWTVSHRLSAAQVATLRTFYRSHLTAPFKFKDVSDGLTYTAVFTGTYSEERSINNRFTVTLQLQEVL